MSQTATQTTYNAVIPQRSEVIAYSPHINIQTRRPTARSASPSITLEQQQHFHDLLVDIGCEGGIGCAVLINNIGQEIAGWTPWGDLDRTRLAVLTVGDWVASQTMSQLSGPQHSCLMITQEHEHHRVFISQVTPGIILLLVTSLDVPTGWVRLVMQRTSAKTHHILHS